MNSDERICSIALTLCPGIGHIGAKRLIEGMGSAAEVFSRRKELPEIMPGVNPGVVTALDCPAAFLRAEQEMEFVEKNRLSCLTLKDEAYPSRLRECEDAPIVLFFKGNTNFNRLHVIDMVGTRRATDYGKQFCADFLRDLAVLCPDVLVVSGLAYGIDIHAHRAALANHLPTVAVLAHGLDRIYPYVHRKTAIDMLAQGGLLTEFLTGTNPDKHNFVSRNRIVAGMSDATIVVESAAKGGSLITAELAEGYHRDCFAVPGRVTDGIFQNQSEVNTHAVQPGAEPGDIRFRDLNNDGVINDSDRTVIGNPNPSWLFSMNNSLSYKGFELSVFLQGIAGNKIYNANNIDNTGMAAAYNQTTDVLKRWQGEGTSNSMPRAVFGDPNQNTRVSDRFVENGSYLRLKNITLSYTFPKQWLQKAQIENARLSLSCENVATITGYSGFDPEVGINGIDQNRYPISRTFSLGLNFNF